MQPLPILGQSLTLSSVLETTFPANTVNDSNTPIPSSIANDDSITTTPTTRSPLPAKRGHKLQVASACSNCKKAHLACDVSRPCKRCISLGKTDTCVDIEHKKRGRPKLLNKKTTTETATSATSSFEVMRGTIQTPIFTNDTPTDSYTTPPYQSQPPEMQRQPKQISFCHQPIEAFHRTRQDNTEHRSMDAIQLTPVELTPSSPASTMSRTDSTMTAIDFDYLNEPPLSSFSPPSSPLSIPSPSSSTATKVTLILSMELCCARISEDITKVWGYYPQELAHRSIYDFIATENVTRLSQLHRRLLDNAVESTSRKDPSQSQRAPPPTERTTSDLFHQKTMDDLALAANGAQTLVDSLLIKTRSGSKEWYDICVHAGGGLGADLDDSTTLTKLYIVMTCQKKKYAVTGNHQQQQTQSLRPHQKQTSLRIQQQQHQRPTPTYRSILPLLSSSSSSSSSTSTNQAGPPSSLRPWQRYAVYGNRPIRPAPHDLRRVSLPAHFANSKLNTISFNNSLESPKINVAPTTNSRQKSPLSSSSSSSSASSPSIPCTYFRPIAAASATLSVSSSSNTATNIPSRLGNTSLHSNSHYPAPRHMSQQQPPQQPQHQSSPKQPFASIAYRYPSQTSTGPRETPTVTHPTTQYFLQTSSSTLNAAADHSRRTSSSSHTTSSSSEISSRKQGISIRSLLC
ncbi:hypothetical protein BCR42DRAFT_402489 [Absidia repens]|uniref:Zn(2)-C6 fungal-type domain-containing protein n=1 Tax=Absidia repens TaxID=90262 RepID=A0A1X2IY85_9FUNG|nr:hypothetical protein BCR42DRAFT_402489 [Absidia repens]